MNWIFIAGSATNKFGVFGGIEFLGFAVSHKPLKLFELTIDFRKNSAILFT
jgi:hypothetical protein